MGRFFVFVVVETSLAVSTTILPTINVGSILFAYDPGLWGTRLVPALDSCDVRRHLVVQKKWGCTLGADMGELALGGYGR